MSEVQPSLDDLRPGVLRVLGLAEAHVRMRYDTEYPECVCMIVLADVGPSKMEKLVAFLRAQPGQLRLYARVIERKYRKQFTGLSYEDASALAADYSIATVRSE